MLPRLPVFLALFVLSLLSACGDNDSEPSTIADYVRQESRFSSLEEILSESGQLSVLDEDGPFTLFAAVDGTLGTEELLTPAKLAEFAGYHIHEGGLSSEELKRLTAITTLAGPEIHVRFGLDGLQLNDGVAISGESIVADNGVIHIIDKALVRPLITTTTTYERSPGLPLDGFVSDFVSVSDTGFLHSLRVEIEIEQESVNSLLIFLQHIQTETFIRLAQHPQSKLSDMRFVFADSSDTDIQNDVKRGNDGQAYPNPTYRPFEPLEKMTGEPIEGEWELTVLNFGNEDETSKLVRWKLIATYGVAAPEQAIVFDPRGRHPGVLAREFNEAANVVIHRAGGLTGEVSLTASAGDIDAIPRTLTPDESLGALLFPVPASAEVGPRSLKVIAQAGDVSRILLQDTEIVQPDKSGIELLAHLSPAQLDAEGHEGNDIWGWTDPMSGKEIAIIGTSIGTAFVDISTPESPVMLGSLPTHTGASLWRDVKVYQNYAYVVSEAFDHGLQIFDLEQLRGITAPQSFAETSHIDFFGNAHNIAINEDSGTAYVVGADIESCFGGLLVYDLQDPGVPAYKGCFSGGIAAGQANGPLYPTDVYTHDVQCVTYAGPDLDYQGREICFSSDEQTIGIADFEDRENPVQIVRISYQEAGYTHQGWLSEDHRYFIMNDEFDEVNQTLASTRSYVWDLQDLDNPVFVGNIDNPRDAIGHNSYVLGNVLYQANYTSGLRMVDLGNIASLPDGVSSEVAYYDTYPEDDARCNSGAACGTASYDGAWSTYPFFASGVIVVSDIKRGLFVLRQTQ